MSREVKQQLYLIKGMVSELDKEGQDKIYGMVSKLHTFIDDCVKETDIDEDSLMAVTGILSAEMALKLGVE